MTTALVNTLMGMGVVFVVLIFIAFVISLFNYLPKPGSKKAPVPTTPEPVKEVAPVVEEVQESTDDTELVAVITAAIMSYKASIGEEVPADGLVVRSIRKRGFAK